MEAELKFHCTSCASILVKRAEFEKFESDDRAFVNKGISLNNKMSVKKNVSVVRKVGTIN